MRGQHRFFQLRHPIAAQGLHPVVLLHALVAIHNFPAALPVVRAGVLPAGQDKDGGIGRHEETNGKLLLFQERTRQTVRGLNADFAYVYW